jgi:hypothetical protein
MTRKSRSPGDGNAEASETFRHVLKTSPNSPTRRRAQQKNARAQYSVYDGQQLLGIFPSFAAARQFIVSTIAGRPA